MSRSYRRKPTYKPDKGFKEYRKRIRRAKEKQALRERKEIPVFKHNDIYDYN